MGGRISSPFSDVSAGTNSEFIKIKINGKVVPGNSKVDKFSDYFDGYSPNAFHAFAGVDGTFFDMVSLRIKVTKETQSILENFFKRGGKKITIEIVHRESNEVESSYSSYTVIYDDCLLHDLLLTHGQDSNLMLELSFTARESVSLELNIPSSDRKKTDKIGPIVYNLQKEILV
ncbi:type VI secretion protein [Escherichia coli]|nr:type VI secretion protein [Escherichia coli]EFM1671940.1 type VI secretion protein [Escherichia coli]EGM7826552.1 type VI secretion protein [Escherichia coli]EMA8522534.1 type VI secretion protein [Escherichia coli]